MIDQKQAEEIVLRRLNPPGGDDPFVISSVELSPRGDYWIIGANSEAYVVHGDESRRSVGVNAYLVHAESGEIETVGSGEMPEDTLQDKYDEQAAGGMHYTLVSAEEASNMRAITRLRGVIQCSLSDARELISGNKTVWATGRKREVTRASELLAEQGIVTEVKLSESREGLPEAPETLAGWDDIRELLHRRIAD